MSRDEFDRLVQRLGEFARQHPTRYRLHVAGLAALGYAYLFGVLLFLLLGAIGLVWLVIAVPNGLTIRIAAVLGILILSLANVIVRALCVRLTPPEGLEIPRAEAPVLFAMLDELWLKLNAPRLHRVLLTGEFNAGVLQIPRLGLFGWQRSYLLVGLPMLQGMSPEQFRAVMAHEFGHLSRNHSRFSAWIYRVRRTWDRVFEQMARQRQKGAGIFLKFIRWYGPYFNGYSFVLARANEYEADQCSVKLAGLPTAGEAMLQSEMQNRLLTQVFWPGWFQQAAHLPAPPATAYTNLAAVQQLGPPPEASRKWLAHALHVRTNNSDTHPCLKDRLTAMGYLPPGDAPVELAPPAPPRVTAAQHFLDGALEKYRLLLESRWHAANDKGWKQRFDHVQKQQQRLAVLKAQFEQQPPTVAERFECGQLLADLQGDAAAAPFFHEVLKASPDHPGANFLLGRQFLARDDAAGVALIEKAMNADVNAVKPGCDLLFAFYQRTGQHEKLGGLYSRFDQHAQRVQLAQQERATVSVRDTFIAHQLAADQVLALRAQLEKFPDVKAAHLVRKAVKHLPEVPFYILAVQPDVKWFHIRSSSADQQLARRLVQGMKFPGQTMVFVSANNRSKICSKVRRVAGAQIFARARR